MEESELEEWKIEVVTDQGTQAYVITLRKHFYDLLFPVKYAFVTGGVNVERVENNAGES